MNYINPDAPAAGLTRLLNMRDNNPAMQLAYMPTKDIAAMDRMGAVEFNPYSGIPQARGVAAVAEGGSIDEAPLSPMADELASRGRYGDSMLLHVRPDELQGLASLGTLTINPDTGLPEAFSFKSILPAIGAIGAVALLGPAGLGIAKGALGTGLAAGFGSFAGGLAAGQSPGQAALGGLLSGATAGFFAGAPTGVDAIPGVAEAGGSTLTDIGGQGFVEGAASQAFQTTLPTTTANVASSTAASAAVPELPQAMTGIPQAFSSPVYVPKPTDPVFVIDGKGVFDAPEAARQALKASGLDQANQAVPTFDTDAGATAGALRRTPEFSGQVGATIDPKTYEAPNAFQKALGVEDFTGRDFITRQEYIRAGGRPDDLKLSEFFDATARDPKTYLKGAASIMMQPPPVPEFQELEPLDSGPSYVPRRRTLVGGQPREPETTAEILARMTGGGDAQPLASQFRYISEGGLVALQEGGIPTQGQPVVGSTVLEEQEKEISERARQDEIKERDKAMSRGQQFIQQPTGNEQLFKQMQVAGEVIGQQIAQGQQAYATPYGQKAPTESFNTGADFGFYQGGLVGLSNGGTPKEIFEKESYQTLLDMGVPWNELKGIISGEHFPNTNYLTAVNDVGATGLFQFIPDTLETLGVTQEEVTDMSAKEQADLYAKYLKTFGWKKGVPLAIMQASPGRVKRGKIKNLSSDSIIYDKESAAAKQNEQWQNKEGDITPKSISSYYKQHEEEFNRRADASGEDSEGMLSMLANVFGGEDTQYKIQAGDTLFNIAKQKGMSLDELLEANKNISNPNVISRGQEITIPDQSSFLDRVRGALGYAQGGDIGQYFEGQVQGRGDGMSDQILFEVEGDNPDKALLSRDEYVIPADVVAMLGNGSSNAGSDQLDKFIKGIRQESFGTQKQQRELNAQQGLRGLV